ncbi:hypothetical protein NDU88_001070 [Pleurodeles waltl]|uniref:Secreted protein n=1 Tax=Pleurodeles waltl TaxID=8319 RepID=A0AAV7LZF4_PLEWA|nr:hypothetical protein NDU88_001070 [Pleurodeles waltl]
MRSRLRILIVATALLEPLRLLSAPAEKKAKVQSTLVVRTHLRAMPCQPAVSAGSATDSRLHTAWQPTPGTVYSRDSVYVSQGHRAHFTANQHLEGRCLH